MKIFKFILVFILSAIQTLCGAFIYNCFINPPKENIGIGNFQTEVSPLKTPGFWPGLIFLLLATAAIMWLRLAQTENTTHMVIFGVLDLILSPVSIIRVIVGTVLCLVLHESPELTFTEDAGEPVICYLFYVSGEGYVCDSPGKIFRTQLFGILPLCAALSGCAWLFISCLRGTIEVEGYYYPLSIIGIIAFSIILGYTKSETIVSSYQTWQTEFRNDRSGASSFHYGRGYANNQGNGWHKVSEFLTTITTEKTPGIVIRTILNILLSPIMVFGQLLGVVAALVGLFTHHVQSWLGPVNYYDVPGGRLQWIIGYLCSFTIC